MALLRALSDIRPENMTREMALDILSLGGAWPSHPATQRALRLGGRLEGGQGELRGKITGRNVHPAARTERRGRGAGWIVTPQPVPDPDRRSMALLPAPGFGCHLGREADTRHIASGNYRPRPGPAGCPPAAVAISGGLDSHWGWTFAKSLLPIPVTTSSWSHLIRRGRNWRDAEPLCR